MGLGGGQFCLEGGYLLDTGGHGVGEEGEDGTDGEVGRLFVVVGVGPNVQLVDLLTVMGRRGGVRPGAFGGVAGLAGFLPLGPKAVAVEEVSLLKKITSGSALGTCCVGVQDGRGS